MKWLVNREGLCLTNAAKRKPRRRKKRCQLIQGNRGRRGGEMSLKKWGADPRPPLKQIKGKVSDWADRGGGAGDFDAKRTNKVLPCQSRNKKHSMWCVGTRQKASKPAEDRENLRYRVLGSGKESEAPASRSGLTASRHEQTRKKPTHMQK